MGTEQDQLVELKPRKEELSEAKTRLLQQRLRGIAPQKEDDRIGPRPAGARVPLSAEQRSIWLHASQQPDVPIYNEPFTIHRRGSFDFEVLQASFNEILRRHEAWRTGFSPDGEVIIQSTVYVSLPFMDLSGLPWEEREAEALRMATEDAQMAISIDSVPLFRARVLRFKEDEHRLYLSFHHIIFDGVSISRTFLPELMAIYASLEQGRPSPLSSPLLQYGDYAVWRERHVDSPAAKKHLAYWLDHLSGELPVLRLPEDRPRPAVTSHRGLMECFEIPAALLEDLSKLSQQQGVTLYTTLLAGFNVLLFRYSGQTDLIVGSVTDARRRPELEGVMGYFLDTFAIRTRPSAQMRFSEYLAQTRESVLGGLAAADVPFDRVVQKINPKRDTNQHPIFQAFFSMRPPLPPLAEGWDLTQTDVAVGTSKFDLYLEVGERPGHMEARFFYSTDIWEAPTIRRMTAHWLVLLQSVCQKPESTLSALPILTSGELATFLGPGGWNDTSREFPQVTVSALIEDQTRRRPEAVAASFGDEQLTYRGLNTRADVLALSLRAVGVAHGSTVAIVLDRSLDMLAGLLAVLKTGAAYLPVDIQMPVEGIALCLADAKPSAILTQRSMVRLVTSSALPMVLIDPEGLSQNSITLHAPATEPTRIVNRLEDLAYLIYTSGTTGKPKGVEISHASLVNLLTSMQAAPGFGSEDVLLAVTTVSFDIAALELFLPLISGGRVVIASREEAQDPYLLTKAISRSGCTVMQATPSTWRTLLLSGWDPKLESMGNSLRGLRVLCGGEALTRELADRLLATGAQVWNMYGPTETTIWSVIHPVDSEISNQAGRVAVGRPIANTQAFILDEQRQFVPAGVMGELFLGGAGLAKGYRGQSQQTAHRFSTVPVVGGARLFRTGDLGVQKANGIIEVLGRTDNQVKVRGYRMELEAVEAAVLRHPRIAVAAARAWPEATGDSRLSIYVVGKGGFPPNLAEIRAFIGESLPDYMIPSDIIALPAIPLTSNGKIDRAQLREPPVDTIQPVQSTLSSPEEVRLGAIWADLLRLQHVGRDDNFFNLGGHSVLVAALQRRLAVEFGQRLAITELFHRPTIRLQVELLRRFEQDKPTLPPGMRAIQPSGTRTPIFWVNCIDTSLSEALGDEQPFLTIWLTEEDVASLGEAPMLQRIAACYVRKIVATQAQGPYNIGGLCLYGIVAFEIASQLRAAGHEVPVLVLLDTPNPAFLGPRYSFKRWFSQLRYDLKRTCQTGLRVGLVAFRRRLQKGFAAKSEVSKAREMTEAAAFLYEPKKCTGRVILLQASDRPSHIDLLPGWRSVVVQNLLNQYVNGHHTELMKPQNVRGVADALLSAISSK